MRAYNIKNEIENIENVNETNKSVGLTKVCAVSLVGVIAASVLCVNLSAGSSSVDTTTTSSDIVSSGVIDVIKLPEGQKVSDVDSYAVNVEAGAVENAVEAEVEPVVDVTEPVVKTESEVEVKAETETHVNTESEVKAETETHVNTESEVKVEVETPAKTETPTEAVKETNTKNEEVAKKPAFTYSDVNKTMYAKSAVNVRNLPNTAGTKLGGLSKAQAVSVTGQCNETGWYRIDYNGGTAYVSNAYLVNEKPAPAQTTNNNNTTNDEKKDTTVSKPSIDISHVSAEKAERIKSVIVWEADYSKDIENAVIYELNKLPDKILNGYLSVPDADIIIVPSLSQYDGDYNITGRIDWAYENRVMTRANIYIENSVSTVQETLLHEIGHYVNATCECVCADYTLENYTADAYRFSTTEHDGFDYFAQSEGEYFAELFLYTINNGVTDKYADTYKIQSIINNFKASL